jgi:hypothetical protein
MQKNVFSSQSGHPAGCFCFYPPFTQQEIQMNNNLIQPQQPDPTKAVMLKPRQRSRKRQKPTYTSQSWQPHQSSAALDSWGVALRTLREQGHQYE